MSLVCAALAFLWFSLNVNVTLFKKDELRFKTDERTQYIGLDEFLCKHQNIIRNNRSSAAFLQDRDSCGAKGVCVIDRLKKWCRRTVGDTNDAAWTALTAVSGTFLLAPAGRDN